MVHVVHVSVERCELIWKSSVFRFILKIISLIRGAIVFNDAPTSCTVHEIFFTRLFSFFIFCFLVNIFKPYDVQIGGCSWTVHGHGHFFLFMVTHQRTRHIFRNNIGNSFIFSKYYKSVMQELKITAIIFCDDLNEYEVVRIKDSPFFAVCSPPGPKEYSCITDTDIGLSDTDIKLMDTEGHRPRKWCSMHIPTTNHTA